MSTSRVLFHVSNLNLRAWRRGWIALFLAVGLAACGGGGDDDETPSNANANRSMELSGLISAVASADSFTVEGVEVDASDAVNTAGTLSVGKRVEAEGKLVNGVFLATRIELEDDVDFDGLEIWGEVENLDTAPKSFVLRGVTVNYAGAVFEDGTEAQLANGRVIEVEGDLAADGLSVDATRIDYED
jgi:hypothetical protein